MTKYLLTLILLIATIVQLDAQIDGDNIFAEDQVITINLEFPETNYWTTLVANYDADENEYIPAALTLTDNTGTYELDSVGVRLKGNSSYGHPGNKKSFKIDFNKFISGQDYDGLKKLNFSNGFKDPSCIREKVFSDVSLAAGVPAPRTSFANVTFNGTPWGFYTIVEQIDDQFLDWRILDDNGNLFKAGANFGVGPGGGGTPADLVYYGADQASYEDRYELKTNEDVNDWTDLIEFIDFINNTTDEEFIAGIGNEMEFTEYLRSAALDNLFGNLDSYTGSARNYYIYHNLTTDKWEWIKWDGNESFGTYSAGAGNVINLSLDHHDADRPLLERIFEIDEMNDLYLTEICNLMDEFFNSAYMDNRIDEIKTLVQASVYADNNKMYSNADFDTNIESDLAVGPGPGGGSVYGLKSFVVERNDYINGVLDCSLYVGIDELELIDVEFYPNPATDVLYVNSNESKIEQIIIYDLQGKIIMNKVVNKSGKQQLDLGNFNEGVFLLQIVSQDGETGIFKFVKE